MYQLWEGEREHSFALYGYSQINTLHWLSDKTSLKIKHAAFPCVVNLFWKLDSAFRLENGLTILYHSLLGYGGCVFLFVARILTQFSVRNKLAIKRTVCYLCCQSWSHYWRCHRRHRLHTVVRLMLMRLCYFEASNSKTLCRLLNTRVEMFSVPAEIRIFCTA